MTDEITADDLLQLAREISAAEVETPRFLLLDLSLIPHVTAPHFIVEEVGGNNVIIELTDHDIVPPR